MDRAPYATSRVVVAPRALHPVAPYRLPRRRRCLIPRPGRCPVYASSVIGETRQCADTWGAGVVPTPARSFLAADVMRPLGHITARCALAMLRRAAGDRLATVLLHTHMNPRAECPSGRPPIHLHCQPRSLLRRSGVGTPCVLAMLVVLASAVVVCRPSSASHRLTSVRLLCAAAGDLRVAPGARPSLTIPSSQAPRCEVN